MTPIRCANGASAARHFVQLSKRRYFTAATYSTISLDFLTPHSAFPSSQLRIPNASPRLLHLTRSSPVPRPSGVSAHRLPQIRNFTVSSTRSLTTCIQNPLKDEDGNVMTLEITSRAAKRLSEIMVKDQNPNIALRIQVESGGCHGFQYLISLITIPTKHTQELSSVVNEDDSIFQYASDDADPTTPSRSGPKIILDEPSLDLLKGSKVDFTKELIGSQFKIVDNPYATSSCGCGTSFDVKM